MSKTDWTLYIKGGCPWCADAMTYLRKNGYAFDEIDVRRDGAAFDKMKKLSGQTLTPTLVVESTGALLPDFDVGQLESFLQENGLTKPAA